MGKREGEWESGKGKDGMRGVRKKEMGRRLDRNSSESEIEM